MTEMHDVVEMLLNRMKDYPEDFVTEPNSYEIKQTKWQKALSMVQGVATTQEREALDIRLEEAQRVVYMGAALRTMLGDGEPEEKYTMKTVGFGLQNAQTNGNLISQVQAQRNALAEQIRNDYQNAYAINNY